MVFQMMLSRTRDAAPLTHDCMTETELRYIGDDKTGWPKKGTDLFSIRKL
jgi:hypothetical protein